MAKTWQSTPIPSPEYTKYDEVASNGDGTRLAACEYGGKVYLSDDSGASWAETNPQPAGVRNWWSIASDLTGSNLVVAAFGDAIYTTSDYGASWTRRLPGASGIGWSTVASDEDGSFLAAWESSNNELWISDDSGATWSLSPVTTDSDGGRLGLAMDADGSHLVIGGVFGPIYTSGNSGASWTERAPGGLDEGDWYGCATSSDGSVMIVANQWDKKVFVSIDYGVNWTDRTPVASKNYTRVTCNADGSMLVVAAQYDRIYYSSDGGVSWNEHRPAGDTDQIWYSIATGKSNDSLLAYIYAGTMYTYRSVFTFQPPADIVTNKRLIAFSNNTLYFEDI